MDEGFYLQQLRALLGTKPKPFPFDDCPHSKITNKYCQCSTDCRKRVAERIRKFCKKAQQKLQKETSANINIPQFIENLRNELNQEVVDYHSSLQASQIPSTVYR